MPAPQVVERLVKGGPRDLAAEILWIVTRKYPGRVWRRLLLGNNGADCCR